LKPGIGKIPGFLLSSQPFTPRFDEFNVKPFSKERCQSEPVEDYAGEGLRPPCFESLNMTPI
jgi:hypothetical protein